MTKLTPSQEEAILYAGDCAIVAAPGSGKTAVLVEKAARLVEAQRVPLDRILLVTFSDRAASELKVRLARRLKKGVEALDFLPIGTIHSFFAKRLRTAAALVDIRSDFQILEEPLARLQRLQGSRESLLKHLADRNPEAVAFVEHFGFHPAVRVASELISRNAVSPYAALLGSLRSDYEAKKRALNSLDFQDLEEQGLKLLRIFPQPLFDWILVDEFQDTSPAQWEMMLLLHHPGENRLVVVGDPHQSIYRFRGARPELFDICCRRIESIGGRLFYLDHNFRSRPSILRFINRVSSRLFASPRPLVATRENGKGGVEILSFDSPDSAGDRRRAEAKRVAERLLELHRKGVPWEGIALLFRTRLAMSAYEEEFRKAAVPFTSASGMSLLERPEVIAALFALTLAADPNDRLARFGLEQMRLQGTELVPIREPLREGFPEFIDKILPRFDGDPTASRNLSAFRDWVDRLLQLEPVPLGRLLETLKALREEEAPIPCPDPDSPLGVRLLTAHGAKGLEFPFVFLCDLPVLPSPRRTPFVQTGNEILLWDKIDGGGLKEPLVRSGEALRAEKEEKKEEAAEAARLLYVAMTRAEEELILPFPKGKNGPTGSWLEKLRD